MNKIHNEQCSYIRKLSSEDAASWLISEFSIESKKHGEGIMLLPHRSWKKSDQLKLAKYYFKLIPFASSKTYEIFFSIMSVSNILKIIKEFLPSDSSDLDLFMYHFSPVLKKNIKTDLDKVAVDSFFEELKK